MAVGKSRIPKPKSTILIALIGDKAAIVAHREMAVAVRVASRNFIQEGKTQEQAVAATPTADFDAKVGNAAASGDRFVTQAYTELKRTNATR